MLRRVMMAAATAVLPPIPAQGPIENALDPLDAGSSLTLSSANLKVTRDSGTAAWRAVRSLFSKASGKRYFEITNNANGSTSGDAMWGFMEPNDSLTTYPGNSVLGPNSIGWQPNLTPNSARFQDGSLGAVAGYGTVAAGQHSRFAIDFDAGKLWVRNSSAAGWAGGGDPAAGTSPTFTFTPGTQLYVSLAAYSSPQAATINFGASAFNAAPPTGFTDGWGLPGAPWVPELLSQFTASGSADAQGVATDGTHVWYNNSTTIFKYTKAGALVTSRNVSADAPATKTQINGIFVHGGVLYVSAAENSVPRKSWIVQYDPDTLAYIAHNQIIGDWFSEGLAWKDGYWWVVFHTSKLVAKVDPTTWAVSATYPLTFKVTGGSGGYGSGTGYGGVAWIGDYLLCNIHEIYLQDYLDVYFWNGTSFEEVGRLPPLTPQATQGIAVDPVEPGVLWYAERNYSGTDRVAKARYL